MKKSTILIFLLSLSFTAATQTVIAQESTGTPQAKPKKIIRDPFWPVGFSPVPKEKKEQAKKKTEFESRIKWPKLKLKGLTKTKDKRYIAVLDKFGVVEKGVIISAEKDGLIYRWRIDDITDKGIKRTRLPVREKTTVHKPKTSLKNNN
jgi:hypothetical protein